MADFAEPGGSRKQVRKTFDTRREAVDWLAEVRTGRKAGTLVAPDRQTVAQVLDTWLLGRRDLKPSTRHGYENALKPVRERLGSVPAQQLTKRHVEELGEHMLTTGGNKGRGRAPGTIRHTLIAFEQAMDDAERQGQVARNVVRMVKKPKQIRHEMRTWSAAQLAAFLEAAKEDRFAALWRVAAFGLRRAEVCGLRWEDVDFETATVRIVQTRVAIGPRTFAVGEPKTASGKRTIPLDAATVEALLRLRRQQARERLAAGEAYADTGWIAVDELGLPIHPDNFGHRFDKVTKAAKLPPIRLHDLRHTAASLMHESGTVSLRTLAAMLGHADPSFTLRTYAHGSDESMAAASATLASLFDARSA